MMVFAWDCSYLSIGYLQVKLGLSELFPPHFFEDPPAPFQDGSRLYPSR